MKKNISVKVLAAVLAAVSVISTGAVVATVNAAADKKNVSVVSVKRSENAEIMLKGCDWNYSADSFNAVISCDFDYTAKTAKFIAKGKEKGITNAVLKTKNDDGTWNELKVKFVVDGELNVKAETETTVPETKEETSKPETKKETSKSETKKTGNAFTVGFHGYDWTYKANSLNVKISCDFDYTKKNAEFTVTGVKTGKTNAVLKVKDEKGKWTNIPMTFTVNDDLDVTGKIAGDTYTTEK